MTFWDCPKFHGCNAPICPIDPDWQSCAHLPGEGVCLWLRELSKPAGEALLRGCVPTKLLEEVVGQAPAIISSYGDIRRQLNRASKTPSKVASGHALRAAA